MDEFAVIPKGKKLEALMITSYKSKTESIRDALKAFLYRREGHIKSPTEVRKILDKRIPKGEKLSEDIVKMRR